MLREGDPRSDQKPSLNASSAGALVSLYSVSNGVISCGGCNRRLGGFWFTRRLRQLQKFPQPPRHDPTGPEGNFLRQPRQMLKRSVLSVILLMR